MPFQIQKAFKHKQTRPGNKSPFHIIMKTLSEQNKEVYLKQQERNIKRQLHQNKFRFI